MRPAQRKIGFVAFVCILTAGAFARADDAPKTKPHIEIIATGGTAAHLQSRGIPVSQVNKVAQGRPHIVDKLLDGEVDIVFNTTEGWQSLKDSHSIRTTALTKKVPYFTTASASLAAARAIEAVRGQTEELRVLGSYPAA